MSDQSNATPEIPDQKPTPALPADMPSPKKGAAAQRRYLRAKMSAVLQTYAEIIKIGAEADEAISSTKTAQNALRSARLPATDIASEVEDYISGYESRWRCWSECWQHSNNLALKWNEAYDRWLNTCQELSLELDKLSDATAEVGEDLHRAACVLLRSTNDVKFKRRSATNPGAATAPPADPALLDSLRRATAEAAMAAARAFKIGPSMTSAWGTVLSFDKPTVAPPVRPTEEEIRRYLSQMEAHMARRLAAHQQVLSLAPQRAMLMNEVDSTFRQLQEAISAVDGCFSLTLEQRARLEGARAVHLYWESAYTSFGRPDLLSLDSVSRPAARRHEKGLTDNLRQLMRSLAIAKARDYEASASLRQAKSSPPSTMSWDGIERATTWQECLDWRAEKDLEAARVGRENISRNTKIELLQEAVSQYERELQTATTELHRFLVETVQDAQTPPCDELRILLNASAWMCNPQSQWRTENKKQSDYPIY